MFSWDGQEKCVILVLIIICIGITKAIAEQIETFFFLNEDSVNDFTRAFLNPNLIDTKA